MNLEHSNGAFKLRSQALWHHDNGKFKLLPGNRHGDPLELEASGGTPAGAADSQFELMLCETESCSLAKIVCYCDADHDGHGGHARAAAAG